MQVQVLLDQLSLHDQYCLIERSLLPGQSAGKVRLFNLFDTVYPSSVLLKINICKQPKFEPYNYNLN